MSFQRAISIQGMPLFIEARRNKRERIYTAEGESANEKHSGINKQIGKWIRNLEYISKYSRGILISRRNEKSGMEAIRNK